MLALCVVLCVVYAALVLSRQRSSNIEGWQVVKVLKQKERLKPAELEVVLEERAACAAIAASATPLPSTHRRSTTSCSFPTPQSILRPTW